MTYEVALALKANYLLSYFAISMYCVLWGGGERESWQCSKNAGYIPVRHTKDPRRNTATFRHVHPACMFGRWSVQKATHIRWNNSLPGPKESVPLILFCRPCVVPKKKKKRRKKERKFYGYLLHEGFVCIDCFAMYCSMRWLSFTLQWVRVKIERRLVLHQS